MSSLRAEIVAIGDELTSGQRVDTNSVWLSQQLGEIGIEVRQHTTVGDDLGDCQRAFQQAGQRADLVIVTGGLGPTADDLTRQALAAAAGVELVLDQPTLDRLLALYARRGREMPEANRVQALFPQGSRIVPNPGGTAAGIDFDLPRKAGGSARFFCLPGVPYEMHDMWQATVVPAVVAMPGYEKRVTVYRVIKCFGVGESDLEAMLPDLIRRGREPKVGITVHQATITLRIAATGPEEAACLAAMQPTIDTIHERLGQLVFGAESDELEHAVLRLLAARGLTLATCEWATGGKIAGWLTAVPEADGWYRGGETITSGATLTPQLSPEAADDDNEFIAALAEHVREHFAADLGLAVGPFPPEHDRAAQRDIAQPTAGKVHMALASAEGVKLASARLFGHRDLHRPRIAKAALDLVRQHLLASTGPDRS